MAEAAAGASGTPAFDAILVVTEGADARLGGLSLLQRSAFTLARAGARRILCVGTAPREAPQLPPVPLTWSAAHETDVHHAFARSALPIVVVLRATVVVDVATVAALAATSAETMLVAASPPAIWCGAAADVATMIALATAPDRASSPAAPTPWHPPAGALLAPAGTREERRRAEDALFARLGRSGDGWFTRHVDRRLSQAITRRLARRDVSPNQITVGSMCLGIVGGLAFVLGTPSAAFAGALLFLLSTILDGCDGELARLTFRESAFGARLDLVGDNVVHVFLFGGIALGLYRAVPSARIAVLGILLVTGVALAMLTVVLTIIRGEPTPAQRALFDAFGSREFAYLLVVLTAIERLEWFLWMSALGTYAFVAGLVILGRRSAT